MKELLGKYFKEITIKSRDIFNFRPDGLGMSQTQAPCKKISHQAEKMTPCVFSNYPVSFVRVVLWMKVEANVTTSCKPTYRNTVPMISYVAKSRRTGAIFGSKEFPTMSSEKKHE